MVCPSSDRRGSVWLFREKVDLARRSMLPYRIVNWRRCEALRPTDALIDFTKDVGASTRQEIASRSSIMFFSPGFSFPTILQLVILLWCIFNRQRRFQASKNRSASRTLDDDFRLHTVKHSRVIPCMTYSVGYGLNSGLNARTDGIISLSATQLPDIGLMPLTPPRTCSAHRV